MIKQETLINAIVLTVGVIVGTVLHYYTVPITSPSQVWILLLAVVTGTLAVVSMQLQLDTKTSVVLSTIFLVSMASFFLFWFNNW